MQFQYEILVDSYDEAKSIESGFELGLQRSSLAVGRQKS